MFYKLDSDKMYNDVFEISYWVFFVAVLPDTSQGFNRSEFERNLRDELLVWFTSYFPPEREEDVFNAINWYYSPWPHVDDEYLNREAFNFVRISYFKIYHF